MQISKFPLWICALALSGGMTLHAQDTQAQAAARQALEQKMNELDASQPASPAAPAAEAVAPVARNERNGRGGHGRRLLPSLARRGRRRFFCRHRRRLLPSLARRGRGRFFIGTAGACSPP